MADLRNLEQPAPNNITYQGTIVATTADGKTLGVNIKGNVLPARWADPLVVAAGDSVLVEISGDRQGEAFVKCRLTTGPRPAQGTVKTVPPSSATITVTGTDGIDYLATFAYTAPAVNDVVILSWNAATPTALNKVTTTTAPPIVAAPVAPPPGLSGAGSSTYPPSDSDTYWPSGGWGAWAGGGSHVYQGGASYGGPVYGAWFYAGSPAELSGRTIKRIQLVLGTRRNVGAYNSAVTLHVYSHSSANKPGADVTRVDGPYDVVIQPGAGPQTIDLPLTFAATLQTGGGIAIAGEEYAGITGRNTQPDSGTIIFDWTR